MGMFGSANAGVAWYGLGAIISLTLNNAENSRLLGEAGVAAGECD